jgi:glycosyltransferase involved in cell wall biosynthesis
MTGPAARQLVVIGPTPPPFHGVAVMTRYIVEALDELGLCAGHLDTRDPRPVETLNRLDATNVILAVRHARQLHRILRLRTAADVLLPISQGTWGFLRDAVLVLVTRLHGRQVILQLHGGGLADFHRRSPAPMRWLIRAVFGQAHQAWALTPGLCSQFDGLVVQRRVRRVENVTQDTALSAEPPGGGHREAGGLRVLFLSNILIEKGCLDVVAIVRHLADGGRGWEVRLAGPADSRVAERLQREISGLPPGAARVAVVGPCDGDAKDMQYRWADVFLYPTRLREGQPLVLLEAMAAGLPIVATQIGGIPDTVRHGAEGLLVPRGDVAGFSDALLRLASNKDLRGSLGRGARGRYEKCYRPERLRRDLAELLLGPAPDPPGSPVAVSPVAAGR